MIRVHQVDSRALEFLKDKYKPTIALPLEGEMIGNIQKIYQFSGYGEVLEKSNKPVCKSFVGVPYGPESNYALGYRGITWGDLLSQKNSVVLPRDKNTKLVPAANYEFVGTYKVFGA
jgi:hypothetical protein